MRIEIIGGMGVGKTTLCNALEKQGLHCVFEKLDTNPYLALSYDDPEAYGFYSQISFILGNFYKSSLYKDKDSITFLDYSTITDKAYSTLFLEGRARDIALDTLDYLEEKEGKADLYLHLTCSPETQLKRIRGRNRDHEKNVGIEFVQKLDAYINRFAHIAELEGARVLSLDTEAIDLRCDDNYVTELTMKIRQIMQTPLTGLPSATSTRPVANHNSVPEDNKAPIIRYAELAGIA